MQFFKICLKLIQNWKTHETNAYFTILGGCWREKVVSVFGYRVELITFEFLAAERLRLMEFDNRLIIDCFANVVNIVIWQFSTNDRFKSEKYESITWKNPFPEMRSQFIVENTSQ